MNTRTRRDNNIDRNNVMWPVVPGCGRGAAEREICGTGTGALGSSEEKALLAPALHMPEPLSTTSACTSSSSPCRCGVQNKNDEQQQQSRLGECSTGGTCIVERSGGGGAGGAKSVPMHHFSVRSGKISRTGRVRKRSCESTFTTDGRSEQSSKNQMLLAVPSCRRSRFLCRHWIVAPFL